MSKQISIVTYRKTGNTTGDGGYVVIGGNGQLPGNVATKDWVIDQEYVDVYDLGKKLEEFRAESMELYWSKEEITFVEGYLLYLLEKIKAGYADEAGDSLKWAGHLFDSYLNQFLLTTSDVIHKSVTAKSLTEEDNPDNENIASSRLKETDGGYLGDMNNVEEEANTAMKGSMLIKGLETWSPMYPTYSEVSNHDNLLMPVFNTLTKSWQFITVPSGGVVPPVSSGFPYTFPITLS